jgi:hypothetical protein
MDYPFFYELFQLMAKKKMLSARHLTTIKTNSLGKSQKTLSSANITPLEGVRITRHSPTRRILSKLTRVFHS